MRFKTLPVNVVAVRLMVALCLVLGLSKSSWAAEPSIESVSSPICQAGSEFDFKIEGEGFTGCKGLVFYSSKIRCTGVTVDSDYELTARIKVDSDCEISNQPYRVLSKFGFSDLRTIRVTNFSVVAENSSGETRVKDTSGTTYQGVLEAGDIDKYVVHLEKGEPLSVEVEAVRLGYGLLDTVLRIVAPDGKRLLQIDDHPLFQQDPVGSIVAEQSGDYTIEVHESNYQGGLDSHYALHIGRFPSLGVAFPAGGQYGQKLEFELLAQDGTSESYQVDLPSEQNAKQFALLPKREDGNIAPSPLPFRLGSLDSFIEKEPNDSPDSLTTVATCPAAFDGIIDSAGDVDYFRFRIGSSFGSSEVCRIEVFADRIGSPIDSLIELYDESMQLVAANDDWGSHDSRLEFVPEVGADYVLAISDKLGGGKANGVYRVEIQPVGPSLTTFLPRPNRVAQDSQVISIPQGNRVVKRIAVKREYVDGEVLLQFDDLPPGVTASPVAVPADQFWVPAVLSSYSDAKIGGEFSTVTASYKSGKKVVEGSFEQTVDLVHSTADQLFRSVTVDRLPIAITPSVPFKVDLVQPMTGLPAGGRLKLEVRVKREEGFAEPIRVRLPFLPPWVVSDASIIVPADRNVGVFELEARPEASSRTWQLVAEAEVDMLSAKGEVAELERRSVASELVDLEIVTNPVSGSFQLLAGVQGEEVSAICKLQANKGFTGNFVATLEGLPARVTAKPVEITHEDSTVKFAIQVAEDAPLGTFERLQCRLSGTSNGQQVSYVVAKNTQLLLMEEGKLKRDGDGRLLSPLEALRQSAK